MLQVLSFAAMGALCCSRILEVKDVYERSNIIETYSVAEAIVAGVIALALITNTI